MGQDTKIEWAHHTFNPWMGCTELMPWRKDLMRLVASTHNLFWLFLTKRPENATRLLAQASPRGMSQIIRKRLGIGTTVESRDYVRRIDYLVNCRAWASVLFLSCEPLLSNIDLFPWLHAVDDMGGHDYNMGIDWVICGGESGPNARPMHPEWARSLRDQCVEAGVPFHFKQWGEWGPVVRDGHVYSEGAGTHGAYFEDGKWVTFKRGQAHGEVFRIGKKAAGRLLDGREWNEFPAGNGGN